MSERFSTDGAEAIPPFRWTRQALGGVLEGID